MGDTAPEQDPDREFPESQEEIREASMRLPARQREALALREREGLSYDEIAAIMEVNRGTVAQLIFRGRINLLDELRGTALASAAAPSPECERALPLIAMRDDGQLEAASPDAAWLDAHLTGCERCKLGVEVMREAGAAYSTWAPAESLPDTPSPYLPDPGRDKPPRRRVVTLAAGLAALLLLAGLAVVFAGDDPPATPADTASEPSAGAPEHGAKPATAGKKNGGVAEKKRQTAAEETILTPVSVPTGARLRASRSRTVPPGRGRSSRRSRPQLPSPSQSPCRHPPRRPSPRPCRRLRSRLPPRSRPEVTSHPASRPRREAPENCLSRQC